MNTVPNFAPHVHPTARFAHFLGVDGIAHRDDAGACWFTSARGDVTLLHTVDIPDLDLYGVVRLADQQAALDGDLLTAVDRRNSHHARRAA